MIMPYVFLTMLLTLFVCPCAVAAEKSRPVTTVPDESTLLARMPKRIVTLNIDFLKESESERLASSWPMKKLCFDSYTVGELGAELLKVLPNRNNDIRLAALVTREGIRGELSKGVKAQGEFYALSDTQKIADVVVADTLSIMILPLKAGN